MKKLILALILACVMAVLPACDLPFVGCKDTGKTEKEKDAGDKDKSNKKSKKDNKKNGKKDKSDKKSKKDKSDWTTLDEEDSEGGKDKKDKKDKKDDSIRWSYFSTPVALQDGDDSLADGCYVTVKLSDEDAKEYPELAGTLETFDQQAGDEITSYLSSAEKEIREMRSEGMVLGYEEDRSLIPLRSDSKVFSFAVENFSYMGGAHGVTSYSGFSYDPKTGKEIAFSDVVKDKKGLPKIIIDELIAQNDDLAGYFDEIPSDKENLLNDVTERIENNAKDLAWGISYKGMEFFFEDYAMGSYAAGTQRVTVRFKDYPELFSDEYVYDKKGKKPDIDSLVTKLDDGDTVYLRIKGAAD